jgi:hypothetical protein
MARARAVLIFVLVVAGGARAADPTYPLKLSANHRFLVDQSNRPFLMQGDAAWSLIVGLDKPDVETYLRNRQAKGFNTLIVNLLEHKFAKHAPNNVFGEGPFITPGDFSTPNEKYFAYADWVIRKAGEYDMQVLLAPIYLGYKGTDEGWIEETLQNGPAKCLDYGLYLGKRYRDFDNVIWLIGGDRNPESALEDVDLIALGIKENDHRHLMTAHCAPENTAMDQYAGGRWVDLNTTYTYRLVHDSLLANYNFKPTMPYFLIETTYEGEHNASAVQIRRQAYWAVLCGGFGHVMGNNPIWHFDGPGLFPVEATWQQAMDLPGSVGMMYWGKLFRSRDWFGLVPDQKHEIVTSGLGEFNGLDILMAGRTEDRSTVIAYLPTSRKVTVDMSKLSGANAKAWWFDPGTGKSSAAGEFPTTGVRDFTPPGEGDWVLVLDDAGRQLVAPGASQ